MTGTGWQAAALAELKESRLFPDVPDTELEYLVTVAEQHAIAAATVIVSESEPFHSFLILLHGRVRISRGGESDQQWMNKVVSAPSFMGEVPLVMGLPAWFRVSTETDTWGLRIEGEAFWLLLARCPHVRTTIIGEMTLRVRGMQAQQSQQDKMALLGTMTAGLMHELNNPGSAARRAASQLRGNLQRMHLLARSFSESGQTADQRSCLAVLQERVLATHNDVCLSSLQQSDAEESMGEWLDAHGVERAWEIAPTLVNSGIQPAELNCLSGVFQGGSLVQPIEWLEATASSMQTVGLVEDSVSRVAELAQAVKSYAHEGQGGVQDVDVNSSIHATMVMLKHKLREKNIRVQKDFGAGIPRLHCICSGLNQVWTNLLDNAIDAVAPGGTIAVATWFAQGDVLVAVRDDGAGISPENLEKIFDPFFSTKGVGHGSGLGLGIVQRILENYHGSLTVKSRPGHTEFLVHLPADGTQ